MRRAVPFVARLVDTSLSSAISSRKARTSSSTDLGRGVVVLADRRHHGRDVAGSVAQVPYPAAHLVERVILTALHVQQDPLVGRALHEHAVPDGSPVAVCRELP